MNKPLIAEFAALSDYAKLFAADYLAVYACDEILEEAVRFGQKVEGVYAGPSLGSSSTSTAN